MENKRIYGQICCLHRELSRKIHLEISGNGVSGVELRAMIFVRICEENGARVCQRDIERELRLRPSSVSSMLATLERKGLVKRELSKGDARTKLITLTKAGAELSDKNKVLIDGCDNLIQSALTEEEQTQLKVILEKILKSAVD